MKWAAALLLWTVTAPVIYAADWIKISSANFELLTNAPEGAARKTLTTFEQARDFFLREQRSPAGSPPVATIVDFNSYEDYKPYSSKTGDLAYYVRQPQGDYIVISDLGFDRMRVAVHEYVHLLVNHSGLSIPLWLNEGMAEVYSTLGERDGKLVMGEMKRDRVRALADGNWMRLPALLRVDGNSPEYNEENLESMFYAESCLLAHMLMLGDGYADKFPKLLERISATGSSQTAFADVYGKTTSDIEKDLKLYFFQNVQGGAVYRAAAAKVEIGETRPASGPEVGVTLANLTLQLGRTGDAKMRLKDLAVQYPRNADVEGALGYVEEQRDDRDATMAHYRTALALNSGGWMVYWNYARLLDDTGGKLDSRSQALADALQRKPDLTEARLRLARNLCAAGRFSEALMRLQQAPRVESEQAVAMFAGMSIAAFGAKQVAEARQYAEQARNMARTPEEKAAVAQLFAELQQSTPGAPSTETGSPADSDPDRPTLRHKPVPPPPPKKGGGGL
jgi:Tfp pilus assembly protein PilF